MCGHKQQTPIEAAHDGPYEGQTQRLRMERTRRVWRAFPWWTLWLIWPLMGLLKYLGGSVGAGWVALGAVAVPLNLLLAVGLIVIGVVLIARRGTV